MQNLLFFASGGQNRRQYSCLPMEDGQAELTWVAGYIPGWFSSLKTVTHPSTNQGRRRVTSLLPLRQTTSAKMDQEVSK